MKTWLAERALRAVDVELRPIDPPQVVELELQKLKDQVEHTLACPSSVAVIDALPLAPTCGHVTPWHAAVEDPEDAVGRGRSSVPLPTVRRELYPSAPVNTFAKNTAVLTKLRFKSNGSTFLFRCTNYYLTGRVRF